MIPGATTGATVRGSRYGASFQPIAEHENVSDAFITRTEDFISYYAWDNFASYNVTNDGHQSYLTSHFDGDGAPDGAVRIAWYVWSVANNYTPTLEIKRSGTWIGVTPSVVPNDIAVDYSSQDCWALQVDLTNGDGGKCAARIMHYDEEGACPNGAEAGAGNGTWHDELGGWSTVALNGDILEQGVLATPSLGFKQVSGKGTTHITRIESSYWVYEADSAEALPEYKDGSGNEYEAWATYLKADSDVGGSPDFWRHIEAAAVCDGEGIQEGLWRVLCDPEEPDATINGGIKCQGNGAENVYLGEVADISAANGGQMVELNGVGLVAITDAYPPDDLILRYNGTSSPKVGVYNGGWEGGTYFAFWDKNPEGDAWDIGDLAGLTAGFSADAGNDGQCYGLVVILVGSGGRRPTNDLEACPEAEGHPYVQVVMI
jgi:hypothetical protein